MQPLVLNIPTAATGLVYETGIVHYFRPGLFNDFLDTILKFPRTSQNESMKKRAETCAVHLWLNVNGHESNEMGLGMQKKNQTKKTECSRISQASRDVGKLFTLTALKRRAHKRFGILRPCSFKNQGLSRAKKQIPSTFKALESDS